MIIIGLQLEGMSALRYNVLKSNPNPVGFVMSESGLKEFVVPKDQAVFWMDAQGRWCNHYGPFEHPKIIAYFNLSIRRDADGYFVEQVRDGFREKVYFQHADTPLFVVDMEEHQAIVLVLNTGRRFELDPQMLFIRNDHLYIHIDDGYAKFSERLMIRLADWIESRQNVLFFCRNNRCAEIKTE